MARSGFISWLPEMAAKLKATASSQRRSLVGKIFANLKTEGLFNLTEAC